MYFVHQEHLNTSNMFVTVGKIKINLHNKLYDTSYRIKVII